MSRRFLQFAHWQFAHWLRYGVFW